MRFARMPPELVERDQWLLWRAERSRKVPYQPHRPTRRAKSTDPSTWASFDATQAAYTPQRDAGVGFALDGNGHAAIDIDGDTSERAVRLLHDAGCGYIEYSPSGNGLHGWGYYTGRLPRKKGVIDGINVEIYNSARYMSVTGDAIVATPMQELSTLENLSKSLKKNNATQENTEDASEHRNTQEYSSQGVVVVHVAETEIRRYLPAEKRQRNYQLFQLARHLKTEYPDASAKDFRDVVKHWHTLALPAIGTQEFSASWIDFIRGFDAVKYPEGAVLDSLLEGVADDPLPAGVPDDLGDKTLLLARICKRLQDNAGNDPFFIGCRTAARLIGIDHTYASRMLGALVADGVLELVEKGSTKGRQASDYRFTEVA